MTLAGPATTRRATSHTRLCRVTMRAVFSVRDQELAETYATRLSQRILYNLSLDQSRGVVLGCRIGTASLRKGPFFQTVSLQPSGEGIISFDAARFVIKPVLLVALLGDMAGSIRWDLRWSPRIRATLVPSVSSARLGAGSRASPENRSSDRNW